MESTDVRVQLIQRELETLKSLLSLLTEKLKSKKAKDVLLRSASNSLSDVETILLPYALNTLNQNHEAMWLEAAGFELDIAERRLKYADDAISKYGENLEVIG
jgi:hypothetical protein